MSILTCIKETTTKLFNSSLTQVGVRFVKQTCDNVLEKTTNFGKLRLQREPERDRSMVEAINMLIR